MSPSLAFLLFLLVSTVDVFSALRNLPNATTNGKWCVAKQDATDAQLQANIDWACSEKGGGQICVPIQPGGVCFDPNTVRDHASFAMNLFYQNLGRLDEKQCDFRGTGTIVYTDPSHGTCQFISS